MENEIEEKEVTYSVKEIILDVSLCRSQIDYRSDKLGLERKYSNDQYGNPVRYFSSEDVEAIRSYVKEKPGKKAGA